VSAENRKPRLHRLNRVFVRSPIYFITACTHERRKILATASVHEAFLDFASKGPAYGAWVGAYMIMPDHLHLFVSMDDQRIMVECLDEVFEKHGFQSSALERNSSAALAENVF
jgi:REP element-mobilizing transposase RayT